MTNKERQKSLDKKKWLSSEKNGEDMSGQMPYCFECGMQGFDRWCASHATNICTASQQEREELCYCARAYNRMVRTK